MRIRTSRAVVLLASLLVAACGITTSPDRGIADDIEAAADATAELELYEFSWTADYELSEAETGRTALTVTGSGIVDAGSGDLDAVVDYDDGLISAARSLFGDDTIEQVQAFTRIVGDEVYIRGFNTASLPGDVAPNYGTWYEIGQRSQDLGDPFVRTDVLPADVLPIVVEPLIDAGETSITVDRDFVLDLGTRFSQSLYDFGLRVGGGDFTVSVELVDGLIRSLTLDGDDPGAGVERFAFQIGFAPVTEVRVVVPDSPQALP